MSVIECSHALGAEGYTAFISSTEGGFRMSVIAMIYDRISTFYSMQIISLKSYIISY